MFGINEVEDIYLMLFGGRLFASDERYNELNDFFTNFKVFVNDYYKKDYNFTGDYDWYRLIRLYAFSDKQSIEAFANLFREFVKQQP